MKQKVNILISEGGVGDLICSLVAVNYNLTHFKDVEFLVWVPDFLLDLAKHLLPKGSIVRNFTDAKKKYNSSLPGVSTTWDGSFHTPMRTHPVDYAFHKISDKHLYYLSEKNYLQIDPTQINLFKFHLPEKYVVLCCSAAEKVKEMPVPTMNQLISYTKDKGYTPVFLGKTYSSVGYSDYAIKANVLAVDYSQGVNLIDKTNLLEAAGIMSGAQAVIGMDGGLIHLAGCTGTNIIAAYTIASPSHLAPIRNGSQSYKFFAIEPDKEIPNRYYQTFNNFNYDVDYRYFPGWEKVIADITFDKFKLYLDWIL